MQERTLISEALFPLISRLLDNTDYLFWVYDEENRLVFANNKFFQTCNIDKKSVGLNFHAFTFNKELLLLINNRLSAVRSTNRTLNFTDKAEIGKTVRFYESNWFPLEAGGRRYVAGYSIDVTAKRRQGLEIKKLASRLSYIHLSASEALWEWEAEKNHLHINEKLTTLCGYYKEVKYGGFRFWLSAVVHTGDRQKIKKAFRYAVKKQEHILELEYRVQTKDGAVKNVFDRIHIIYKYGKPVRLIGAIMDNTEKKQLENAAINHKAEIEKAIVAAHVHAQEEERDRISKELHDNVNQLILSSKMYISIARNQPDNASAMLDKAVEYQLMALEESRKLSKQMSTAVIQHTGFVNTVDGIFSNLQANGINVSVTLSSPLIQNLSGNQLLMLIRIIQEQTSNILKYAEAKMVTMAVTAKESQVLLAIKDDGKGFDPDAVSGGIGFTNIKSRVSALGGQMNIYAAPGKGCQMVVAFNSDHHHQCAA